MAELGFELRDCQAWRDAGLPMSTTNNEAAKMYDACVSQLFGWINDESLGGMEGTMKAMNQADPNFVMGQVFSSTLNYIFNGGQGITKLESSLQASQKTIDLASKSELNHREKLYVEALKSFAKRDNNEACAVLEDILVSYPTDRLALKVCTESYIMAGQMEQVRDIVGRVKPLWKTNMRQYGYLHGMYGFGLEETGNYAAAEKSAKLGCEWNKYDPWARHCLSHVYEMTGRPDEGIRNLSSSESDWTHYDSLVCHNYWHWGLFHIEKGEFEEALAIYDNEVGRRILDSKGRFGRVAYDSISTLERLTLEGVNVGSRWDDLFEKSRPYLDDPDHYWTFADGHLMFLACHNPKYRESGKKFLESARKFVKEHTGDNRNAMQLVGVPILESIYEYEEGNFERAVDILYPVRYHIAKVGGSEAQRELFHLLLINAALKSTKKEHQKLAKSLIAGKQCLKEESPLNDRLMARAVALH